MPGGVFQRLANLEDASGSLGWRASSVLRLLNAANRLPIGQRRIWLDTASTLGPAQTVAELLLELDGAVDHGWPIRPEYAS